MRTSSIIVTILLWLFLAPCIALDAAIINKIISDGHARNVQGIPADERSRINTAIENGSFDGLHHLSGAARASLNARFPFDNGFDPTDLEGLQAWFKAGTGLTVVDGKASQWNDQSGNGNHATQANSNFRPTVNVSDEDFNNLTSLTMDGTNDVLIANSLAGFLDGIDHAYTVVTVMQKDNSGGEHMLSFGISDLVGNGQWCIGIRHYSRNIYLQDKRDEDGLDEKSFECGVTDENVDIVRWQSNGQSAETFVNGVSVGTGDLNCVKGITGAYCTIGGYPNFVDINAAPYNPMKGKFAELIVYNRLLTAGEQTQIEDYCRERFATY
jgi:hypothetical protein